MNNNVDLRWFFEDGVEVSYKVTSKLESYFLR